MSTFSSLASPGPYHILAYGTLLGSSIYQTFINGIVAYRSLPRAQFSSLQTAIFPVYFSLQTALPVLLALTYPGTRASPSLTSFSTPSGLGGFLAEPSRVSVFVPVVTIFATSLLNWLYLGPATTTIMKERKHQETRDGKKCTDAGPQSREMVRLNRRFGMMHGASSMVNMVGLVAMLWYGVSLGERLR